MNLKIGMIGCGGIGRVHADAAKAVGSELVCASDLNGEMLNAFCDDYSISNSYTDLNLMLSEGKCDAVIIGVPNAFHASLAITAMEAGMDVLVEKPMAVGLENCQRMIDAAEKNRRVLQIGYVSRHHAISRAAREIIDSGQLGNIYHVKTNYYRRRGIPGLGGWFTNKEISGGGPLIDLGVHAIDLAMDLLKFPKVNRISGKVYSHFGSPIKDYVFEEMWQGPPRLDGVFNVEDSAHAMMRLEGGATYELNACWAGNFPENVMPNMMGFFGDKGGLVFDLNGEKIKLATQLGSHNVDITPLLKEGELFEEQHKAFAMRVENRDISLENARQGLKIQAIVEGIYRSSELDCEIEL